jgi:hypothetical protein
VWVAYRGRTAFRAETYIARAVDVHAGEDEMDLHLRTAETSPRPPEGSRSGLVSDAEEAQPREGKQLPDLDRNLGLPGLVIKGG